MSNGFALVIPDEMIKKITEADTKIKALAKTSQEARDTIVTAFQEMATQGVDAFIARLDEANRRIKELAREASGSVTIKIDSNDNEVLNAANSIAGLAQNLERLNAVYQAITTEQKGGRIYVSTIGRDVANKSYRRLDTVRKQMERSLAELTRAEQDYARVLDMTNAKIEAVRQAQEEYNRAMREAAQKKMGEFSGFDIKTSTLNELKSRAEEIKNVLANLEPDTDEWKELNKALQETKKRIKELEGRLNGAEEASQQLVDAMQLIGQVTTAFLGVKAITNFVNKLKDVRAEFEMQNRSLQILLQNRREADILWDKTIALAVNSPFRVQQLVLYTKQLAAYRVESEKLYDTTKMLADISSGLGVDMQRLILAYGQVRAANYLRGTELRQFSEAGINILGELSEYFTQLEGSAVSVAEVFERVSRRMVLFEDVDAVLKNITSEGGTFYKMQEEQAKTLRGQIMNLQDSIDVMLNEIGENTEGALKGGVRAVRFLVEEWETLSIVLGGVIGAFAGLNTTMVLAAISQGKFSAETIKTTARLNGLTGSLAKAILAFKNFGTAAKTSGGIWGIAITAILTILGIFLPRLKRTNDEMERQQALLNTQVDETSKYANKILELSKRIEGLSKANKELDKGSEEYRDNQVEIASIEERRKEILKDLAVTDEGYANQLRSQMNDVEKLKELMEDYNEQIRVRTALELGLIDLGLKDDSEKYTEKENKKKREETKLLLEYHKVLEEVQYALENNTITEMEREILEEFMNSEEDVVTRMIKLNRRIQMYSHTSTDYLSASMRTIDGLISDKSMRIISRMTSQMDKLSGTTEESVNELIEMFKVLPETQDIISESLDLTIPEDQMQRARNEIVRYFEYAFDANNLSGALREKAKSILEEAFGFDWEIKDAPLLAEWQEAYNNYLATLEGSTPPVIRNIEQTIDSQRDMLRQQISEYEKTLADEVEASGVISLARQAEVAQMRELLENSKLALAYLGSANKEDSGSDPSMLEKRIRVIKEINEAYKELSKTFDDAKAKQGALDKFGSAFLSAWGRTVEDMGFNLFTESGVTEAFNKVVEEAKDAAERTQAQLAQGEYVLELEVTTKQTNDEKIKREIEEQFSNYELSLELDELGLPRDLMNKIFGFESIDLSGLKEVLEERKGEFIGTEMEDSYQDFLDKISKLEEDKRNKDLKKYSQYIIKGRQERVKIKMEEVKQLQEIEDAFRGKNLEKEKQAAQEAVKEETKAKLQKLDWEEFEKSDSYLAIFDNLDHVSTMAIRNMVDRLNELKSSLSDLPASDLKAIINAMEKLEKELVERNPLANFGSNFKDAISYLTQRNKLEKEYAEINPRKMDLELRKNSLEEQIGAATQRYEQLAKEDANSLNTQKALENLQQLQKEYDGILDALYLINPKWQRIVDSMNEGQESASNVGKGFERVSEDMSHVNDAITKVFENFTNVFGNMSDKMRDTLDTMSALLEDTSNIGSAIGKLIATKGADISSWAKLVEGISSFVGNIFAIGDKKKERSIQAQVALVEELNRQYERLDELTDKIYSNNAYVANYNTMQELLDKQIISIRKQIDLEESKRKSDDARIKQLTEQEEELQKAKSELAQEALEWQGGIANSNYLSMADDIFSSMYDSFKETGNALSGLETSFDDFFENLVKRQAMLRMSDVFAKQFDEINKMFDKDSDGGMTATPEEIAAAKKALEEKMPELKRFFDTIMETFGVTSETGGQLSTLQGAISGIREEQADIIASYLNSLRAILVEKKDDISKFFNSFDIVGQVTTPLLEELRVQTAQIRDISELLASIRWTSSGSGVGLNVHIIE